MILSMSSGDERPAESKPACIKRPDAQWLKPEDDSVKRCQLAFPGSVSWSGVSRPGSLGASPWSRLCPSARRCVDPVWTLPLGGDSSSLEAVLGSDPPLAVLISSRIVDCSFDDATLLSTLPSSRLADCRTEDETPLLALSSLLLTPSQSSDTPLLSALFPSCRVPSQVDIDVLSPSLSSWAVYSPSRVSPRRAGIVSRSIRPGADLAR